jgi:hypothetical protein
MTNLQEALRRRYFGKGRPRYPLVWSAAKREELIRAGQGEIRTAAPVDAALAPLLLRCADGDFDEAEPAVIELLRQHCELRALDNESFISLLNAAFTVQRFDIVAAMLRDRHGFQGNLSIDADEAGLGVGQLRWEISPSGAHRFGFDPTCFGDDGTRLEILAFHWEFPLFAKYSYQEDQESGSVIAGRRDVGLSHGLAYCDSRPGFFLIPDCVFVPSRGYSHVRDHYRTNAAGWQTRRPVALWRGGTSGVPGHPNNWESLPRIQLCQIADKYQHTGLIDAGITSIVQFTDPNVANEIRKAGLVRGFISWQDWHQYKYLIDIDGNSNAWSGLFQRLLTGSTVLKVESINGYRQWYYDKLVPWQNYVPVASNMWDLMDKVMWLYRHDAIAERIGGAGFALAQELSYDAELHRAMMVVSSAFRYFRDGL